MARASEVPMPIRRPCSASCSVLWLSFTGGGGTGVQIGSSEMSADQPSTNPNTKKLADASSGDPVLSPAV